MRQRRLSVAVAALAPALAAIAAACNGETKIDVDAGMMMMPDVTMAECPMGSTLCSGVCSVTKRDPENCGACGKPCKPGEVCVQGACALQCGGGATKCNNTCVDTKSDPQNCGQCGNKCSAGEVCSAGKCALTCAQGTTDCSGACVDLQTDGDHCGMCGTVCEAGQKCAQGKCVANCQTGWDGCPSGDGGSTCVNLKLDAQNCGACGNPCPNGQFCSNGTCGLTCFGGTTKCGSACVDTAIDPNHCGGCNNSCNGTCFNSQCCSGTQVYCSGACRNLKTDANHCGGCGVVCGGPCNNGVCCGQSEVICNGTCSNTQFDAANCGGCGNACPMNQPNCVNGSCTTCPNTVLVLSDNNNNTNAAFITKLQNAGLAPTLVNGGVESYAGNPPAGNFGAILVMVGDGYSNDMPNAGQTAIVNAHAAGKGVVVTDWGAYHVFNNRWSTLKNVTLFTYTTGTQATLDFKLESMGHPIWTGLPSSFNTTTSMGASGGNIINGGTRIAGCNACGGPGVIVRTGQGGRLVYLMHAANYSGGNANWVNDTNTMLLTINAIKWGTGCLL